MMQCVTTIREDKRVEKMERELWKVVQKDYLLLDPSDSSDFNLQFGFANCFVVGLSEADLFVFD